MLKKLAVLFLSVSMIVTSLIVTGQRVAASATYTGTSVSVVYTKQDIDKGTLLSFTPGKSGYYVIYSDNLEGNGKGFLDAIYDSSLNEIDMFSHRAEDSKNFWCTCYLTKGSEYSFKLGRDSNATSDSFKYTVHIEKYDVNVEDKITGKGGSVWYTYDKLKAGEKLSFTPDTSGYYQIWTADPIGYIEPRVEAYDSQNKLLNNAGTRHESNKQLIVVSTVWFNAGETYKLKPTSSGDYHEACRFSVHIAQSDRSYKNPGIEYLLVEPNESITVYPEINEGVLTPFKYLYYTAYTNYTGKHPDITLVENNGYRIKNGVDNFTTFSFQIAEGENADFRKAFYIFVKPDSLDGTLVQGQTLHIEGSGELKNSAGGKIPKQWIYSYTPSKTGKIKLTSSNIEMGYPTVALFDQDKKFMTSAGGNLYFDNKETVPASYDKNNVKSVTLEAHLEAGKTYYFAFPLLNYGLTNTMRNFVYQMNNDWNIEYTEDQVQQEPSNPTNPTNPTDPAEPTNPTNPTNPTDPTNSTAPSTPTDPTSDSGLKFDDFVERLYVVALNRQSEKEGKDYWCELVGNGTLTGADCARFFLTSPEFKGRNLSDEDFLKVLYSTFFDRNAADDPDGFNFWLNSLKTVGKDTVVEGFINSPEWCNICADYGVRSGAPTAKATKASKNATAFATRLYTECLGRDPEEGGLKFWSLGLTNQELSGTQAAKEFFYSAEFVDAKYSNDEYINRMYKTFMGREAEAEGKAYWLDLMNNGTSRDEVFNFFSTCEEFTGICNQYAIVR